MKLKETLSTVPARSPKRSREDVLLMLLSLHSHSENRLSSAGIGKTQVTLLPMKNEGQSQASLGHLCSSIKTIREGKSLS